MTVKEAAKKLGVSTSTIYRRIKKKIIPAVKEGRRWNVLIKTPLLPFGPTPKAAPPPKARKKKVLVNDLAHELETSRPSIFYAAEDVGAEIFWDMKFLKGRKYKNQVHWVRPQDVEKIKARILEAYRD